MERIESFNSRLREEATGGCWKSYGAGGCFNSRLREEATSEARDISGFSQVSTHASVRRRRKRMLEHVSLVLVSTHASVRRRHAVSRLRALVFAFQLTPP